MKLYEFIITYPNSKEVYKDYRYFKSLKECQEHLNSYSMEVVRIQVAKDIYDAEILKSAKQELESRQ